MSQRMPSIHLNGTSRDKLFEQYSDATAALRVAIKKLEDASPNARDYYLQGPSAYKEAEIQHNARILQLQGVMKEIYAILEHISDS